MGSAQSSTQPPREAGFRRILQPRDGGYLPRDCVGVSTLQEAAEAAFADGWDEKSPQPATGKLPVGAGGICFLGPAQSSVRPRSARESVTSSVYSRSLPMGTPCAIRVTLMSEKGLSSRAM